MVSSSTHSQYTYMYIYIDICKIWQRNQTRQKTRCISKPYQSIPIWLPCIIILTHIQTNSTYICFKLHIYSYTHTHAHRHTHTQTHTHTHRHTHTPTHTHTHVCEELDPIHIDRLSCWLGRGTEHFWRSRLLHNTQNAVQEMFLGNSQK